MLAVSDRHRAQAFRPEPAYRMPFAPVADLPLRVYHPRSANWDDRETERSTVAHTARCQVMVRVELSRIIINERSDEQRIYLREAEGVREFPIVIGIFEAFAIDRMLKEQVSERPLTHDLACSVITILNAELVRALIDDVHEDTYYAKLVLRRESGDETTVDARPSDAITLALKADAPVFVADAVMNKVCLG